MCPPVGKTGATPSWRGLSIWHWVGVGAGSVAVIALVIAVVLVHKSNKRRKVRGDCRMERDDKGGWINEKGGWNAL